MLRWLQNLQRSRGSRAPWTRPQVAGWNPEDDGKARPARPQRVKGTVVLPTGDCPCLNSGTGTARLSSPKSGNAGASPLEPLSEVRTNLGGTFSTTCKEKPSTFPPWQRAAVQ